MTVPDDEQRAALAARMQEFEQALVQLSETSDAQDRCLVAARQLMSALQALINRMHRR